MDPDRVRAVAQKASDAATRPLRSAVARIRKTPASFAREARGLARHVASGALTEEAVRAELARVGAEIGVSTEELSQAITEAFQESQQEQELPHVRIELNEEATTTGAIAALATRASIYQRACSLVDVTREPRALAFLERPAGTPSIRPLPLPCLRERLTSSAVFETFDRRSRSFRPARLPTWVVSAVAARGHWDGIPPLTGLTEFPVLRPDGTVLDQPGYDVSTGLLYSPPDARACEPVPERPTLEQAFAAVADLLDLVQDFPFASPAHRSAWLTIPLTLLARHAISGCTPLVLIDANAPGTGKSLLAETGAAIATGRPLARMTQAGTDEETRKRITSLAISGQPVVLIDNVSGALGSPALDAALTSTEWQDRMLGESRDVRLPLTMVWLATANNATLSGDLLRRTLHVRLETREERPEERAGFRYALPRAAFERRPRLLRAALVLLRGYFAAGRPDMKLRPWGSYEAWSAIVRNALVWAGQPDPAETRRELAAASDTTTTAMAELLEVLRPHAAHPKRITVGELLDRLPRQGQSGDHRLEAVLGELLDERITARRVGNLFRRVRGRVFGGVALVPAAESKGNTGMRWTVRPTLQPSDSGDSSDSIPGTPCVNLQGDSIPRGLDNHPRPWPGDSHLSHQSHASGADDYERQERLALMGEA